MEVDTRPNPWHDTLDFLTHGSWLLGVFWLLLLGGATLALLAWQRLPAQRTGHSLGLWLLCTLVGAMWWQQSLWKVPPDDGGLMHWRRRWAALAT